MISTLAAVVNDESKLNFLIKQYLSAKNAVQNAQLFLKEIENNS